MSHCSNMAVLTLKEEKILCVIFNKFFFIMAFLFKKNVLKKLTPMQVFTGLWNSYIITV